MLAMDFQLALDFINVWAIHPPIHPTHIFMATMQNREFADIFTTRCVYVVFCTLAWLVGLELNFPFLCVIWYGFQ